MTTDFITFGAPDIGEAEAAAVLDTLRSGWLGTGPRVSEFESAMAAYRQVPAGNVIALNSCTAALHLSLLVAGVGPGDEVITPALTFCSAANTILHVGATPVLADVDPITMNMDAQGFRAALTPRTKAVIPMHFAGRPCEMEAIMAVAREHGIMVIEDCAHAVESVYRNQPAGTMGDFGCFSFYATKNLTTGEGGMVFVRDPEHAERIRRLALHGMSRDAWQRYSADGFKHYDVVECGFKFNMMDLQAALGLCQLNRLQSSWQRRADQWARYQEAFAGLPLTLPAPAAAHIRHAHHLYTVLVDDAVCGITRDALVQRLHTQGVGTGVHYRALSELSYYREQLGWQPYDTPVATAIGRTTLSLPLGPKLNGGDLDRVIAAVHAAIPVR
jgi:dTDP-4-amino-4,6-dideoxygalactose transaminase